LCVAGCSSLTSSYVGCTSLSHENKELIRSDLNLLLVSRGFTKERQETYPNVVGFWYAPLRKGSADFTVTAVTSSNSHGMFIQVDKYGLGRGRASKPLTEAIVACVKSNAPNARVQVQFKTDYFLLWPVF